MKKLTSFFTKRSLDKSSFEENSEKPHFKRTEDKNLKRNASGYYETIGPKLPPRPPEMEKSNIRSKTTINTSQPPNAPLPLNSSVVASFEESPYINPATTPKQVKKEIGASSQNEYLMPLPCPNRDENYIELDVTAPKINRDVASTNRISRPTTPIVEHQNDAQQLVLYSNPKDPEMSSIAARLSTFQNYPQWNAYRIKATTQEIADAGWYSLGEGDKVSCWFCGGNLREWEENDDPWEEHAKWFSTCEYLQRRKGVDFVNNVLIEHASKKYT